MLDVLSFALVRRMAKSNLGSQHGFNLTLVHAGSSEMKSKLEEIVIAGSLGSASPIGDGGLNPSLVDLSSIIVEIRTCIEFWLERHRAMGYGRDRNPAATLMHYCNRGRSFGSDPQLVKEDRRGWWAARFDQSSPDCCLAALTRPSVYPWKRRNLHPPAFGQSAHRAGKISFRREWVGGRNDNAISRLCDGMAECVCQDHSYTRKQTGQFIRGQISVFKIQPQILKIDDVASPSGGTFDAIWIKYRGGHQPGCFLRFDLSLMQFTQYKNKSFFIEPTHIG